MAEVRSLVCDVCGNPEAKGWQVSRRPGAPWIIDLCATCARPIIELSKKGRPPAGGRRQYRRYGEKATISE